MTTTATPATLDDLPADLLIGHIEDVLQALVADRPADPAPTGPPCSPGRPPILPVFLVWGTLLVGVLRGVRSQRDRWRLVALGGLWDAAPNPIRAQGLAHRYARAGVGPLQTVFAEVSTLLRQRIAPWQAQWGGDDLAPFARDIVVIDETTLDQVARTLPTLRGVPAGDDRLLPGKLAGVFDLRRQAWRVLTWIEDIHQNEKVVARDLLAAVAPQSLIIADLGYFSFA